MNNEIKRLINVTNELSQQGKTGGSTGERIAAAFILNNMSYLPAQYDDVVYAWQRLGAQWQYYVEVIKDEYRDEIVKHARHQ